MPKDLIAQEAQSHHRKQHFMCLRLEAVADALPASIDRQECLLLARDIYPTVKAAHEFEESVLFPHLQRNADARALEDGLERLRFEHWEDEAYAEELSDTLSRIGRGGPVRDAEKISWMLRGFFDGVRRHMAFEAEHLLPMLNPISSGERVAT
ncbi:MAG: hemerythrin domain-containing protein [Ahrensia sp.]|nr:hemerythrin domain-containing protein [Ahrensia sp.]